MSHRWTRFSIRSALIVVTLSCVFLGLRTNRIQRQKQATADLQKLGAQLQRTDGEASAAWLLGPPSDVREVYFLGPAIGDETIEDIVQAASRLSGVERMVFAETRISQKGEQQLKSRLTDVEVEVFTPVLAPSLPNRR